MADPDEKERKQEIRRKIRKIKEKKEEAEGKIKKLNAKNDELSNKRDAAKDNIKWFDNKEKYINIMDKISFGKGELDKALQDLEDSVKSYRKNFKGDAANAMNSKFEGARNEIIAIKNELTGIWNGASAGKSACENMIKNNNKIIGKNTTSASNCNSVIKDFTSKIRDNSRDIRYYNDKIKKYGRDIHKLQNKL